MTVSKSPDFITNPLDVGLHYDVPASIYHADPCPTPSLSSGIIRTILSRSVEHAAFEHPRMGARGKDATPQMDLGSLVHALLAGEKTFEVGTYPDFKTKAAQAWRDEVRAAGKTPVLEDTLGAANRIVDALRGKVAAGIDNSPFAEHGRSEVTAVWKEGNVYCRARYDRLLIPVDGLGCVDVWDWKTIDDASPRNIERRVINMGYHFQAAFYLRGLAALLPKHASMLSFNFPFVESSAPHAVRRAVLSPALLQYAQRRVGEAIDLWSQAVAAGKFEAPTETLEVELPGYLDDIEDDISAS